MCILFKTHLDPSTSAFILLSTTEMLELLINLLQTQCNLESNLVNFERCTHFEEIQPEEKYKNFELEQKNLDELCKTGLIKGLNKELIITEGRIEFINVSARYSSDSDLVLDSLNFTINPKEKIGVIGKSGAGKSSLIKILWNNLKPNTGKIMVDGKDIQECDLKDYRSQVMVISQETALFDGTLRENIDPTNEHKDKEILKILNKIEFQNSKFK